MQVKKRLMNMETNWAFITLNRMEVIDEHLLQVNRISLISKYYRSRHLSTTFRSHRIFHTFFICDKEMV